MQRDSTVFVVDDDRAVRESIKWLVESIGLKVQTFKSPQDFLDTYQPEWPGCLVLDVRMPGMSGLDLQDRLQDLKIHLPVIVMTGFGDVSTAVRAMKGGAIDFIEKPFRDQTMLDLVQVCLDRDAEQRADREAQATVMERLSRLTAREREVMDTVVAGMSNKEIARELDIAPKTVEAHRAKVMEKMQASSLAELVRLTAAHEPKGNP